MIKVAIAEDDYRVAGIHEKFLLTIDGIEIVGKALNGKETLSLLEENEVDLLLLDIYMPDILGTELLRKIRQKFPQVDVIMITAATNKHMVETALKNGVYDYIIKPLKLERFKEGIENYRRKQNLLNGAEELGQDTIDQFLGNRKTVKSTEVKGLPKGIDPLTLQKVRQIVNQTGLTAEETGEKLGASRTTARRYLEYLTSIGEVIAELEYGIVGRPERKYYGKTP
ncbi:response regulator [Neobacillus mesonae]|uniref:response regulator n=1 Tax=Neobacillus mesonae TaxID=1193713 RepID=UPI00203B2AF7|nr:response regulator [Neobacillus mesonae]MCM3570376.1 response regulator [Neobacillus mesonae]